MRKLAERAAVSGGHLQHVMKGEQGKRPTRELIDRVAQAFGVDPGHLGEYRAIVVSEVVQIDPALRDRLYRELQGR